MRNAITILFYVIVWIIRYLITLPFLSMALILRTNIGKKAYLPWSVNVFNVNPNKRDFFAKPMRYLTLILLYFWVRLFLVIYVMGQMEGVDFTQEGVFLTYIRFIGIVFTEYNSLFLVFENYNETSSFLGDLSLSLPYFFSFYIVILGFVHLLSSDPLIFRGTNVPGYLGDSLIFGWLTQYGLSNLVIWIVLEPLLIFSIGWLLSSNGYEVYAWFFWIAACSTAFLGYERRDAAVKMQEEVEGDKKKARKISKLAKADSATKKNDDKPSDGPIIMN